MQRSYSELALKEDGSSAVSLPTLLILFPLNLMYSPLPYASYPIS